MDHPNFVLHIGPATAILPSMRDLIIGKNYSFAQIRAAYHADLPTGGEDDQFFVLHCGEEIVALCLRHKFNPEPGEVWIGDAPAVAQWGERLAQCKGQKTIPLYYSPRNRSFYQFLGHHFISGDTVEAKELAARQSPVPLSRIVYIEKVNVRAAAPR
jgi:hypothetical protein